MNKSTLRIEYQGYQHQPIDLNSQYENSRIIEGFFLKESETKDMAIRKVNMTLCILLGVVIALASISYYFVICSEMQLNNLSRQTTVLNDENAELENQLDKLKSFNNVDKSMQKSNLLSKAKQVIEVEEVNSTNVAKNKLKSQQVFTWAIGY